MRTKKRKSYWISRSGMEIRPSYREIVSSFRMKSREGADSIHSAEVVTCRGELQQCHRWSMRGKFLSLSREWKLESGAKGLV